MPGSKFPHLLGSLALVLLFGGLAGCEHLRAPVAQRATIESQPASTVVEGSSTQRAPEAVASPENDLAASVHPSTIDDAVADVPSYGLKRGLTRQQVYQLVGRPNNVTATSYSERWFYAEFSYIDFDRSGVVSGWAETEYDRKYRGFGGFPIDFGTNIAFVAPPPGPSAGVQYAPYLPHLAENGSFRGELSSDTGRPKSVYVRGYVRKDGTYVQSHYRSRPRR